MARDVRPSQPAMIVKRYGDIPGIEPGHRFANRDECRLAGVHGVGEGGIHGGEKIPAYSVALSGRYEDDVDNGNVIIYTGEGGRNPIGTGTSKLKKHASEQVHHQTWTKRNLSLLLSFEKKTPIRVIRGYHLLSPYAPADGYVYDGLYLVTNAWTAVGKKGYYMCMFKFERCPNQKALIERSNFNAIVNKKKKRTALPSPTMPVKIDTSRITRISPDLDTKATGQTRPKFSSFGNTPKSLDYGNGDAMPQNHRDGQQFEMYDNRLAPESIVKRNTTYRVAVGGPPCKVPLKDIPIPKHPKRN